MQIIAAVGINITYSNGVNRQAARTIDKFINGIDSQKRLKGYMINKEFMAEKRVVLAFFAYKPFGKEQEKQFLI